MPFRTIISKVMSIFFILLVLFSTLHLTYYCQNHLFICTYIDFHDGIDMGTPDVL